MQQGELELRISQQQDMSNRYVICPLRIRYKLTSICPLLLYIASSRIRLLQFVNTYNVVEGAGFVPSPIIFSQLQHQSFHLCLCKRTTSSSISSKAKVSLSLSELMLEMDTQRTSLRMHRLAPEPFVWRAPGQSLFKNGGSFKGHGERAPKISGCAS
jgi:hypothetical protein